MSILLFPAASRSERSKFKKNHTPPSPPAAPWPDLSAHIPRACTNPSFPAYPLGCTKLPFLSSSQQSAHCCFWLIDQKVHCTCEAVTVLGVLENGYEDVRSIGCIGLHSSWLLIFYILTSAPRLRAGMITFFHFANGQQSRKMLQMLGNFLPRGKQKQGFPAVSQHRVWEIFCFPGLNLVFFLGGL